MESRRDYLKIIGAVGATCAFPFSADELFGQQAHEHGMAHMPAAVAPFEPKFFTADEGRMVARIADLIIPPTDTPGASQAGVPQYIDLVLIENKEHQPLFRQGLAHLDAASHQAHGTHFLALTEPQQIALLTPIAAAADESPSKAEVDGVEFFRSMKRMTADGYYTSYAGLVQELGYKGNQVLASFEGCVHEH